MKNKYYIPTIEEFHVGFKYEMKSTFGDGTVKTQFDYDKAEWVKQTYSLREFPYVDRTMSGKNSINLPPAIRVKYLDKKDFENLGFVIKKERGNTLSAIKDFEFKYEGDKIAGKIEILKASDNYLVVNKYDIGKTTFFRGEIKNLSELKIVLKQIGIT